jgi:hypothetical protein
MGMRVLGRWSHQMRFNKSSSKVERENPLGGVTRQARYKGLGVACKSVIRVRNKIQNPYRKWCQNVNKQALF